MSVAVPRPIPRFARGVWCECECAPAGGRRLFAADPAICSICGRPTKPRIIPGLEGDPLTEEEERDDWAAACPDRTAHRAEETAFDACEPASLARDGEMVIEGGDGDAAVALDSLLGHVFADGPAPADSSRRLVAVFGSRRPQPASDRPLWLGATRSAASARLRILGICPDKSRAALAAAARRRHGFIPEGAGPLPPDIAYLPSAAYKVADFLWPEGCGVGAALDRCYAVAWQLRRDLLGDLTLTDIGGLFCRGRAAPSGLVARLLVDGCGSISPGQKGHGHRRLAARSAAGNHNRRLGCVRTGLES